MEHAEIVAWLREIDDARLAELWRTADRVRQQHVGGDVHLRGLVELSNYCVRLCGYCGLRAPNDGLTRYRMSAEEIFVEYAYFSSFSTSWIAHAKNYVEMIIPRLSMDENSLAVELASKLVQAGAKVDVVMTEPATKFITPLTFRAITGRAVVTDMFDLTFQHGIEHIALGTVADAVVIAPATASIIAKMAAGIADDMVSLTVLATRAPVIVAPAMDVDMLDQPIQ